VLDVDIADITVEAADTAAFPLGIGAFASRTAVTAGSSVHLAATAVRAKAIKAASEMLEAQEQDLILKDGAVSVAGVPDMKISLGAIAATLNGMPGLPMLQGVEPGLSATAYYEARRTTFASGTHVAEVEVDADTGQVTVSRYIVAHDCGRLINPMLVEGQVRGGVVHGIGNALFERMLHDANGQPQTTSYADYLLAGAAEMPAIEIVHLESPSPLNPIGVKGAGEGGTIPATACVIAAIEDALAPFAVTLNEHPVSPARLVELIERARKRA
jgi:carbon-monoxide dehydrogenase large subunit